MSVTVCHLDSTKWQVYSKSGHRRPELPPSALPFIEQMFYDGSRRLKNERTPAQIDRFRNSGTGGSDLFVRVTSVKENMNLCQKRPYPFGCGLF